MSWQRLHRQQEEMLWEHLHRSLHISTMMFCSLKFHLQNAKDHGVTQKEIAAIITHVAFYAGWPKGWAVFNLAKEVWNEEETEK